MSKPKPGLGKGIARTLAHHSHPQTLVLHPVPARRPTQLPLWEAGELRRYVTSSVSRAAVENPATSYPNTYASFAYASSSTSPFAQFPPSLLFDRPRFNDFSPPPLPPVLRAPSPPHTAKPRAQAAHTILTPESAASPSTPLAFLGVRGESVNIDDAPILPDPNNLNLYHSNLIFHLGASGYPKERLPTPPRQGRTPPPPRQRSFPLPEVTPPTTLHSIAVGEDAYFARLDGLCVADGVGGWSRSGKGPADPGRWSRLLTHYCEEEVGRWWAGADDYMSSDDVSWAARAWKRGSDEKAAKHRRPLDPVEIMQKGFEKCLACAAAEGIYGSSTCLLALLHHSTLLVANVGDCSLLLIRRGEVVFRTSEMQHAFNFPLQLGTHSRDEPMKDAKRYDVAVEKEDVVIVGSDGLMDNLFDEDILDTLSEFAPPNNTQPSTLPPFSPQAVSDALMDRARIVSEQMSATTPFMMRAIEEGIDFVGGKRDDISVLVGVIGDREGDNLTLDAGR